MILVITMMKYDEGSDASSSDESLADGNDVVKIQKFIRAQV